MSTPPDDLTLAVAAALWGASAGALLPRAAYRFSVPWEEADGDWRTACPAGHPLRGWLGRARCARCANRQQAESESESVAGTGAGDSGSGTAGHADTARQGDTARHAGTAGTGTGAAADTAADADTAVAARPTAGARTAAGARPSYAPGGVLLPLVTAVVCAALALATGVRPELAVWLALAPVGVLLGVVDVRVRRLPDPLTLSLAAAAPALLGLAALLPERAGDWTTALLGALALGAGYLVLHLIHPGGMAFGDVKLALGTGAVLGWYGWPTLMVGTLAAFLSGALFGGVMAVLGRAGRRTLIAFGPFMLVGTLTGVLVGAYAA